VLCTTSAGNPLLLRELVLGARAEHNLFHCDGVWQLRRQLAAPARLRELIEESLTAVGVEARAALEVLAVCGPLGLDQLGDGLNPCTLERLEQSGLVEIEIGGTYHRIARLAHPLYGQVLRECLSRTRTDRILRAQIAALHTSVPRRPADALQVAGWQLAVDGAADPELLLRAARQARAVSDLPELVRLTRGVLAARRDPETTAKAAALLGEALVQLGLAGEAEEVLAEAMEYAPADDVLHRLAIVRAVNLVCGIRETTRAVAAIDQARTVLDDSHAAELHAATALVQVLGDRPADAARTLEALPPRAPGTGSGVERLARVATLTALGRTGQALRTAATFDRRPHGLRTPSHQLALDYATATALHEAGHVVDAVLTAERALGYAVESNLLPAQASLICLLGRCHLTAGRARTARRWLREAVAVSRSNRLEGPLCAALGGLAITDAYLGADRSVGTYLDVVPVGGNAQPLTLQATAWAMQAKGEYAPALRQLSDAADAAAGAGQVALAAAILHDMARLGAPERAMDRLAAIACDTDSPMIAIRVDYVRGALRGDADLLASVSASFAATGAYLFAAEAAAEGSRRSGYSRQRAALAARVASLLSQCEGSRTPPVVDVGATVPLSKREREICVLAARGMTSSQIAQRLRVSVRTVHNHLQNAYQKLGITRRRDLAAAMGLTRADSPAGGATEQSR
jgi:DNA-binding CsgD family transcriptional regulator